MSAGPAPGRIALWPLPALAGALPAVAALVALALYREADGSRCFPFVADCISISRMARHETANPVFRALVLPAAALQVLTWLVAARQFAGDARRAAAVLAWAGAAASIALAVYASFLGTEGEVYRFLRRWGTLAYFGSTVVAMAAHAFASTRHGAGRALPAAAARTMHALLGVIVAIALLHATAALAELDALESRIENLTEWWSGLAITAYFGVVAALWWRWRLTAEIVSAPPGAPSVSA